MNLKFWTRGKKNSNYRTFLWRYDINKTCIHICMFDLRNSAYRLSNHNVSIKLNKKIQMGKNKSNSA